MPLSSPELSELNETLRRFVDDENRRSEARRANERFQDKLSEFSERLAKVEAFMEVRADELSDTKRFKLVEMGVLRPNSVPPKRHNSEFPKIVGEIVKSKWAVAAVSGGIVWLLHHLGPLFK